MQVLHVFTTQYFDFTKESQSISDLISTTLWTSIVTTTCCFEYQWSKGLILIFLKMHSSYYASNSSFWYLEIFISRYIEWLNPKSGWLYLKVFCPSSQMSWCELIYHIHFSLNNPRILTIIFLLIATFSIVYDYAVSLGLLCGDSCFFQSVHYSKMKNSFLRTKYRSAVP